MANLFKTLQMPAGDGPGPSVDTSGMGKDKSFVVDGEFPGVSLAIEVSTDGGASYATRHSFTGPGKKTLPVASELMRVRVTGRSSAPFSATVGVGANDNGALFASLPLPVGVVGAGPAVDVSSLGTFTTVVCEGEFPQSSIAVQASEDGVAYFACGSTFFSQGGLRNKEVVATHMRAFVKGFPVPPTTKVSVGAINDAGSGDSDELVKVSNGDTSGFLGDKLVAGPNVALSVVGAMGDEKIEVSSTAPPPSPDELVKASPTDVAPGVLSDKVIAGPGVILNITSPGGDEKMLIAAAGALVDEKVKVSAGDTTPGELDSKLVAGTNITLTKLNPGADEQLKIDAAGGGGAVLQEAMYRGDTVSTSSNAYVDGMSGSWVAIPEDGNYWAMFEGEGKNQAGSGRLEVGISIDSVAVVVANSERETQGDSNDIRTIFASVDLGARTAGEKVRMLLRKKSGAGGVQVSRRWLGVFKKV